MINKKHMLLFATLLIFLIGTVNATDFSDNDTTDNTITETTIPDDTGDYADDLSTSSIKDIQTSTITRNTNENITQKTSGSITYNVNDFDSLYSALTSDEYETVTINIKSNIMLDDDTELNDFIETLTINGNGKTIDG